MSDTRALLSQELAAIEARLRAVADSAADDMADAPGAIPSAAPGRRIAAQLGLDPFARDVLLLAAAPHLNPRIAPLCARITGDPAGRVTAAVAMACLADGHWSALRPDAPLRALRCIRLADPDRPTMSELLVDERILLALLGQETIDERLLPLVMAVPPTGTLHPAAAAVAAGMIERWHALRVVEGAPALHLRHGEDDAADARAVAAAIAERLGCRLFAIAAALIPSAAAERHGLAALWRREERMGRAALLIEMSSDAPPDQLALVADLADRIAGPLLLAGRAAPPCRRALIAGDVPRPDTSERHALWVAGLGPDTASRLNGSTEALAEAYEIGATAITRLSALARGMEAGPAERLLRGEARATAQARIAAVADVIHPTAGWDDIVVPDDIGIMLQGIAAQVRHRRQVHDGWGFAARGPRGLGIAALFAGPSGTGKTLAAEVIAGALDTDLVRVDLAGVVSKYIGETEKNLARVFAAAEGSGAVLLFDEADALFGKRSEVSNAHDRYANIEVSYLLQRMESYTGLAILTTNQRESLDHAFLRRLRFVIHFPFPDEALRRAVWERAFPPAAALGTLDFARLSRLNVAPGNIRTIAINAAFLAAQEASHVTMRHLHQAAIMECRKLEQPITAAELGNWQ